MKTIEQIRAARAAEAKRRGVTVLDLLSERFAGVERPVAASASDALGPSTVRVRERSVSRPPAARSQMTDDDARKGLEAAGRRMGLSPTAAAAFAAGRRR